MSLCGDFVIMVSSSDDDGAAGASIPAHNMQGPPILSLLPPPSRFNMYIHPTRLAMFFWGTQQNHVLCMHILISSLTICPAPFLFCYSCTDICYSCTDIFARFGKFGVLPMLPSGSLPPTYIMQNSAYSPVRRRPRPQSEDIFSASIMFGGKWGGRYFCHVVWGVWYFCSNAFISFLITVCPPPFLFCFSSGQISFVCSAGGLSCFISARELRQLSAWFIG